MREIMSVPEAAERLGVTEVHLRTGIKQGMYPFAVVVDSENKKRKRYIIYKRRFEKWLEGSGIG